MLKIENVVLPSAEQMEAVIRGMRNPMNSWEKSDSKFCENDQFDPDDYELGCFIGENDQNLMRRLAKGGPVHAKYRRMIPVYLDITAPLYWWKEFDTYKVGTVANSCSTMHKIQEKEFTIEDFSCEHLMGYNLVRILDDTVPYEDASGNLDGSSLFPPSGLLALTINMLNQRRDRFLKTSDKQYWWQMIQLLPSSYNQKRTVMLNYEVLYQIYKWRRNHKLDEWHIMCDWIKTLPYADGIIFNCDPEPKDEKPIRAAYDILVDLQSHPDEAEWSPNEVECSMDDAIGYLGEFLND